MAKRNCQRMAKILQSCSRGPSMSGAACHYKIPKEGYMAVNPKPGGSLDADSRYGRVSGQQRA